MRLLSFALIAVCSVSAFAEDKALTGDLAKLQGAWTTTVGPDKNIPIVITITKDKVEVTGTANDNEFKIEGEIKIDEKASPKTLDLIKFKSSQGDELPESLLIYKFDGDNVTVCSGGPGNPRPTEFKDGEGGPPLLNVWVRKAGEAKPKDDLSALQGKWKAQLGPNKDRSIDVEFNGNAVTGRIMNDDGDTEFKGEFTINNGATPKTIDFVRFKDKDGGEIGDNLALYKLEGDTLTICTGGPGNARPAEFRSDGGDGHALMTFTRQK